MARVAKKTWRWFLVAGVAFAAGMMLQVSFRGDTAAAQYPQQQVQAQPQQQRGNQPRQRRAAGLSECLIVTLYKTSGRAFAGGAEPRTVRIAGWRPIGGTEDGVVLCR